MDAVKPEAFPQPDYAENCWAILFLKIDDGVNMSLLMEKKWLEMIQAFSKLTLEERVAESEKRLDETLERMAQIYNISSGEAYEKLVENRNKMHR